MRKPFKAVLLSALVYPGLGHFLLKHYIQGCLIIVAFTLPLWFLISDMVAKTNQVIAQIQNGQIPLDSVAISDAISNSSGTELQTLTIYSYVMLGVWIIGIVDVYRISRKNRAIAPSKKHSPINE